MNYNYHKKHILINEAGDNKSFTARYEVLKNFLISNGDGWNIVFYKGNLIEISFKDRAIIFLNKNTKNWETKDLNYSNFMDAVNYAKFTQNTKKITLTN